MDVADTDPIALIAQSTAGEIGGEFLTSLVRSMHTAMDVSIAFITRGVGDPPRRARITYSWKRKGYALPEEYDLEGTPCRLVYQGQHVLVPEQLWRAFPKEVGREGYCGVPLEDSRGRIVGHFSVISDTPMEKPERVEGIMRIFGMRVEAELQRLERDLEREDLIARLSHAIERLGRQHQAIRRANAFKAELLNMVAHDLRSPLAVIVSRSELIASLLAQAAPGASGALQKIETSSDAIGRAAERMARMISDLLVSARKDAMAIELQRAGINLAEPVRVAIGLNHAGALKKGIRIAEDLRDAAVLADEDRLVEAFDNLLSNAVKYSGSGGTITVAIGSDRTRGLAHVTVSDDGQGMDAQDLALAFQRFQQLSAKPTGGETSTGLGLAIVKSIAEAHGGSVAASSAGRGKGSTFTFVLPLREAGPKGTAR
jgi:signal transduction histidine kinase